MSGGAQDTWWRGALGRTNSHSLSVCVFARARCVIGALISLMMHLASIYHTSFYLVWPFHIYLTSCNEKPGDLDMKVKVKHRNCAWDYVALFFLVYLILREKLRK